MIVDDKESEVQNYDNLVIDLNGKIKEKSYKLNRWERKSINIMP